MSGYLTLKLLVFDVNFSCSVWTGYIMWPPGKFRLQNEFKKSLFYFSSFLSNKATFWQSKSSVLQTLSVASGHLGCQAAICRNYLIEHGHGQLSELDRE